MLRLIRGMDEKQEQIPPVTYTTFVLRLVLRLNGAVECNGVHSETHTAIRFDNNTSRVRDCFA